MKAYTDLEQSRKLAEILPLESADMYYFLDPTLAGNIYHLVVQRVDVGIKNLPQYNEGDIPCWSLSALLDVLPYPQLSKDKLGGEKVGWMVSVYPNDCRYDSSWHDNAIDACCKMIIKLKEINLL